jgi:hypothetical protein
MQVRQADFVLAARLNAVSLLVQTRYVRDLTFGDTFAKS